MADVTQPPVSKGCFVLISDGEEVKPNNGTNIESKDNFSRLTIQGTSGVNSGSYTIKAVNCAGEDQKEFDVLIKGNFNYVIIMKTSIVICFMTHEQLPVQRKHVFKMFY